MPMLEPSFDPEDIPHEFMMWRAGGGQSYEGASYAIFEGAFRGALERCH